MVISTQLKKPSMKFKDFLLASIFLIILNSCSEDDTQINVPDQEMEQPEEETPEEEEEPIEENAAPSSFNLISLEDGTIGASLTPNFTWAESTDSDNDTVLYDFYLGDAENNLNLLGENLSDTEFTINESLQLGFTYYWQVIAKDDNGAEVVSETTYTFTTRDIGLTSEAAITNQGFMPRIKHQTVVFQGKVWLIGGYGQFSTQSDGDVWSSEDGLNFTLENKNAFNKAIWKHTCVVFNNKIWLFGTQGEGDILSSTNGKDWILEVEDAPFQAREEHSVTVWNNKLWVIGGYDPYYEGDSTEFKETNDVWSSDDGVNWTLVTEDAGFPVRRGHSTLVFNNQLYLFAGYGLNRNTSSPYVRNDIWTSSDGEIWTEIDADNLFDGRNGQAAFVFKDRIWMIGGSTLGPSPLDSNYQSYTPQNDVWYTKDGIKWIKEENNPNFGKRSDHTGTVFNDKAYINAGWYLDEETSSYLRDIWIIE